MEGGQRLLSSPTKEGGPDYAVCLWLSPRAASAWWARWAKRQSVTNPGKKHKFLFDQALHGAGASTKVVGRMKLVALQVVAGENGGRPCRESGGKKYSPPEDLRHDLGKLKEAAESLSGRKGLPRLSSRCPHISNDSAAAKPLRTPGRIAGLEVMRIINEPTARALAYGLDKKNQRKRSRRLRLRPAGTFDISIPGKVGDGVGGS